MANVERSRWKQGWTWIYVAEEWSRMSNNSRRKALNKMGRKIHTVEAARERQGIYCSRNDDLDDEEIVTN